MTTHLKVTCHKSPGIIVRLQMVSEATSQVMSEHVFGEGNSEESCSFTIYEGVRLQVVEDPAPVAATVDTPPPAPVPAADAVAAKDTLPPAAPADPVASAPPAPQVSQGSEAPAIPAQLSTAPKAPKGSKAKAK